MKKIIELVKTGLIMTIPLLLCGSFGLFGCGKSASRQSEDLVRLSVSCLASNYAASYSFDIEKMGNLWLISADFESESGKESVRTKLESEVLDKADVEMLLTAVDDYKVIERVINYKKNEVKWEALDETEYNFTLKFSDGTKVAAPTSADKEFESILFAVALKYFR